MTCLHLLYKMRGGQIDIDANSYQTFIRNLELKGVIVIGIGKIGLQTTSIFTELIIVDVDTQNKPTSLLNCQTLTWRFLILLLRGK